MNTVCVAAVPPCMPSTTITSAPEWTASFTSWKVITREIVGSRQAVPARADDHAVVRSLQAIVGPEHPRLGMFPGEGEAQQSEGHGPSDSGGKP
jgi:hypothetical protein